MFHQKVCEICNLWYLYAVIWVLEDINEAEKVKEYLYGRGNKNTVTEVEFVLKDYSDFNSENRKKIREIFKGKYLRCIFIQKENFKRNSKIQDWRTEFYQVLEISKIS